ncbi:hypothetical protein [Marinomonas ostreistagni]|uniref:hypothetical protein n=1 Tax=Marinomonas ostreistagni TaxID=359209 RepID=UPI00194FA88E|nr:hypothetical protein [Marinomonas ostreistagni]MBM6550239.1 hypothetical protein [Marinomonas ostreistagni]
MTASNSPFTLRKEATIQTPSQAAWDLLISPNPSSWNHAIGHFESTFGFHTGSRLDLELQSLKGPWLIKAEVTDAQPMRYLALHNVMYHWCVRHHEFWQFELSENQKGITHVMATYTLEGLFAPRLWPRKHMLASQVLELWLESLKHQLEKF